MIEENIKKHGYDDAFHVLESQTQLRHNVNNAAIKYLCAKSSLRYPFPKVLIAVNILSSEINSETKDAIFRRIRPLLKDPVYIRLIESSRQ